MDTVPDTIRDPEGAPKTTPGRGRKLAIAALATLVLLAIVAYAAHRPLAAWWIRKEARARGAELDFDSLSLSADRVVLRGSRAALAGLPFVSVEARVLEIAIDGLSPVRLDASGVVVSIEGPVDERLAALATFAEEHRDLVALPVSAAGSLRWGTKESPWLSLEGRATSRAEGKTFDGTIGFEGTNLGLVVARVDPKGMVSLGLGAATLEASKLRATLDTSARPMKLVATLPSVSLAELFTARSLATPKALATAKLEGTTTVLIGDPAAKGMYTGTSSFVLSGFVPPHPRELDGIVFGKSTKVSAAFEITQNLGELRISKATMKAGAFELAGPGTVTRSGTDARLQLDLKGSVPCSELGASAVGAHVKGFVGDILQGVARFGLGGAVGVRVQVDADTKALDRAKVEQSAEVGCGLR